MSLYPKCFLRVYYNCVPNFMLVSSKAQKCRNISHICCSVLLRSDAPWVTMPHPKTRWWYRSLSEKLQDCSWSVYVGLCAFATTDFSVAQLFGDACVMHAGDVTCPSHLGLRVIVVMLGRLARFRTSVLGMFSYIMLYGKTLKSGKHSNL